MSWKLRVSSNILPLLFSLNYGTFRGWLKPIFTLPSQVTSAILILTSSGGNIFSFSFSFKCYSVLGLYNIFKNSLTAAGVALTTFG